METLVIILIIMIGTILYSWVCYEVVLMYRRIKEFENDDDKRRLEEAMKKQILAIKEQTEAIKKARKTLDDLNKPQDLGFIQ